MLEFPGIHYVLPDGIESARDGCHGGHEIEPQPDEESGIFLAKGLPRSNLLGFAVSAGYPAARYELQQAADKGNQTDERSHPEGGVRDDK